jgi:hypothetical protein
MVLSFLVKYNRLYEYIVTEKGTIEKERYYFPLNFVDYFDGATIYFKLTKEEVNKYKKD